MKPQILQESPCITIHKTTVFVIGKKIYVTIWMKMPDHMQKGNFKNLLLVHRSNPDSGLIAVPFQSNRERQNYQVLKSVIDCNHIQLEQFYWDIFVEYLYQDERCLLRVDAVSKRSNGFFYLDPRRPITKNGYVTIPYLGKNSSLSLIYRQKSEYDSLSVHFKECFAFFIFMLFRKYIRQKNIWLIYEKYAMSAQDNGFYFFRFCQEKQQHKHVYYIMDKNSPELEKLRPYHRQVLKLMSLKHMVYSMGAALLVSSEIISHSYAWRRYNSMVLRSLNKKPLIFLQHGVIALKRVDNLFHKDNTTFIRRFVTSSAYEKDIIVKHFGYMPEEVIVTGLARWDALEDKQGSQKEILVMPTWRSWLEEISDREFMQSDYYRNYTEMLNNVQFHSMLEENDMKAYFYIHPKFKEYIHGFVATNNRIEIIPFGTRPLSDLIQTSSLLITDYSSVAWDVYYLGKPVIFYQFDLNQYNIHHGSYMNMDTDLFGDRTFHTDDLMQILQSYVRTDFAEKSFFAQKRSFYFQYHDHNQCQRIYDEIQEYEANTNPREKKPL